jgi:hypothetical protein
MKNVTCNPYLYHINSLMDNVVHELFEQNFKVGPHRFCIHVLQIRKFALTNISKEKDRFAVCHTCFWTKE